MSVEKTMKHTRILFGRGGEDVMEIPNLIDIQTASYERFLQRHPLQRGEAPARQGLEEVFQSTFPIESPNGDMLLEYCGYTLDEQNIKFGELECKQKGITYAIPLKAKINLVFLTTGEIRQKEIYMGDLPIMTDKGTFIVNGAERVVVSQIHRSPGVIFSHEKGIFSSRIIPYRGSWLEFEIDQKKELIYAKIDRKKRILATVFLRALGYETRESIVELFYRIERVKLSEVKDLKERLVGRNFARGVTVKDGEATRRLYRAGDKIHPHDLEELAHAGVKEVHLIDFEHAESLHSSVILNCFEREEVKLAKGETERDEISKDEAILRVYAVIKPGEPITIENAEKDLQSMFFSSRRYDLGRVGRYKLNKKFGYSDAPRTHTLIKEDIVNTATYLIKVWIGEQNVDDIDHLGNRRVRSVGELLTNQLKVAFSRMERIAKERMSLKEADTIKPQDLISIKPIVATIKEFFGSSQLSQFMDQVNPLAELTHKRRLNALGPGGLSRDRAGFEVRDVHYTHYGRMCPIETPEGPNIGLIVSLANYTRVNEYGFLETPYRKVKNSKVSTDIEYLSAMDEERYFIAQANAPISNKGEFLEKQVPVRKGGDYITRPPEDIQYMDVSPKQIISVSASLIPFLEHDDANRALMGSNMQRQAVPLVQPEAPRVGTGMEAKTAYDSGVMVIARRAGSVAWVSSTEIQVKPDEAKRDSDVYPLQKYQRTNQDTCYNQKPIVTLGQHVEKGAVLADGPSTSCGELALGRNMLCAFMPWNGYNYEDAILISEKVVEGDLFTSIHIKEFSVEVRETKLGPEKITRDIPNTSEHAFEQLDEEGIIRVGAMVKAGSILVGKVTPKSETDSTPEFKLLNSIFGEKAKEVRDTSLRVPHGVEGTIIDVQRLKRANGDELDPGRRGDREGADRRQAQAPGGRQDRGPARQQGRHRPGAARRGHALHGGRDPHRDRAQSPRRAVAHEPRPDHGDRAGLGRHGARRVVRHAGVPVRLQRDDRGQAEGSEPAAQLQGAAVRRSLGRAVREPDHHRDHLHAEAAPPRRRQDARPLDRPLLAGHPAAPRRQGAVRRPAPRRDGGLGPRGLRRLQHAAGAADRQERRHARPGQDLREHREGRGVHEPGHPRGLQRDGAGAAGPGPGRQHLRFEEQADRPHREGRGAHRPADEPLLARRTRKGGNRCGTCRISIIS